MADKSGIEWTDATWNPLAGCSIVSSGCTNCYAMKQAARLLDKPGSHYEGTTKKVNGNAVWTGKVSLAPDHIITQPLRWKRPRRIFVNSMSDLFHESVPDEWIDQVFAIMALCPHHIFQVLTKRPERMREYMINPDTPERIFKQTFNIPGGRPGIVRQDEFVVMNKDGWPIHNVWLGVSVEDQRSANERIPLLLDTPAAVRFLSCEPLLGPVDLTLIDIDGYYEVTPLHAWSAEELTEINGEPTAAQNGIDWVIVGGESGPGARAMHPDWVRSLRDQCTAAGVPFFFKQWGEWQPFHIADHGIHTCPELAINEQKYMGKQVYDFSDGYAAAKRGKKFSGRELDGREWDQFPEALK